MICSDKKIVLFAFRFFFVLTAILVSLPLTGRAQYYFGRNKVQYNQFDWHVMRTEHFEIYFYPEMEELAKIGAKYAEESYQILQARFDQTVQNKIPLIFYSSHFHFQETHVIPYLIPEGIGGFFEFIKGRVVIPANGSLSQFRQVIQHELVHVFSHSKISRVLKDNKKLEWGSMPLWFTEGLAEYWSTDWDSQAEMFLRDAVLNNYLVPVDEIYQINGSFLMYKEGQAICRYIAQKYGEDKLLQLFENYWKVEQFSQLLKLTIGKDYREFDEDWIYALKKIYYPLLHDADIPGQVTMQITRAGINTKPAYFRRNGEPFVVFYSNRLGYSNIYCSPLQPFEKNKNNAKIVIKGERTYEFESFHQLQSKLDVSRAGDLAFIAKSGGRDAIYLYDLNANHLLNKIQFNDLIYLASPAVSPEGDRIVFSAIDYAGRNDLYVVRVADRHLIRLTNDLYDDRDPSWSSDGESIVFSSDRTEFGDVGAYNLFQLDLKNYSISYITHGNFRDFAPVWSLDGGYLAFSSDRDGSYNLWMIRAGEKLSTAENRSETDFAGSSESKKSNVATERYFSALAETDSSERIISLPQLKQLTHFVTGAFDPEWTDDGSLVFTAFEGFSFQIRKLTDVIGQFNPLPLAISDRLQTKPPFWIHSVEYQNRAISTIQYKRRYSLDLAQSYVTQDPIFGTAGGAQLAVSDILGNTQYYFLVYNNAETKNEFLKSFNVAITRVDLSRRINLAYGGYHFAGRYYNYSDGYFFERRYGGYFGLSYPLSIFKRVEATVNIRNSEKEWFSYGYSRRALLISNFISLVKDNSLWSATGPIDGNRYNLVLGNTVDIQHSNVNFYTVIVDYRHYLRITNRMALASRWLVSFNIGKETVKFYMGGSWDLRGYRYWSIWGEKMVLISEELRFPFIDRLAIRFPFGGVGFSSIRGAAFVDNGNAWDGAFHQLFGSYGVGIRFNLGGFLVLRLDYGKKFYTNFNRSITKPQGSYVLPGTFTQFFFGWDF